MEKPPRPIVDLSATCACGKVSLRLNGKVRAMFMCACLDCQKATGTGHSTVAMAHPEDVTVSGVTKSFSRTADSGAIFTRHFCGDCGTQLFGASSRAPDALLVPVGLFGADNDWFRPSQVIFARSHHDWDLIAADLPKYATYRDQEGH